MIALEDCIALSGLTGEEIRAIAEHERLHEILAAALAKNLLEQERGTEHVRTMIVDDIRQAQQCGDRRHEVNLLHVLHHFLKSHPEAVPVHLERPALAVEAESVSLRTKRRNPELIMYLKGREETFLPEAASSAIRGRAELSFASEP